MQNIDLAAIARAVAPHLPGWTERDSGSRAGSLQGAGGRALYLTLPRPSNGRFLVRGIYPAHPEAGYGGDMARAVLGHGVSAPEVGISLTKTPEHIARDIQRRFLPDYEELFVRCVSAAQEVEAFHARQRALGEALAHALGRTASLRHGRPEIDWYVQPASCTVTVESGDRVSISLRGLGEDLALKICRLLDESRGADGGLCSG